VRGEALIPMQPSRPFNASEPADGAAVANPRNACAGTLRHSIGRGAARRLEFFAYTSTLPGDWQPRPASPPGPQPVGVPELLAAAGFRVQPPTPALCPDLASVEAFFRGWETASGISSLTPPMAWW